MEKKIVAYDRRRQVLALLAEHGPLSVRGLRILMEPKIQSRRIRDVLHRLHARHILYKRRQNELWGTVFYQVDRHEVARRRAAKILGVERADSLRQPGFKYFAPANSELLTLWKVRLLRLFPGAKIYRKFEIEQHPEIKSMLPPPKRTLKFYPDLLFLSPPDEEGRCISIAIELQDWCKHPENYAYKLSRYVRRSRLDGVLILSDLDQIAMWIETFQSSRRRFFPPGRHLHEFFWMFSDDLQPSVLEDVSIFTAKPQRTNLKDWIAILRAAQGIDGSTVQFLQMEHSPAEVENVAQSGQ